MGDNSVFLTTPVTHKTMFEILRLKMMGMVVGNTNVVAGHLKMTLSSP